MIKEIKIKIDENDSDRIKVLNTKEYKFIDDDRELEGKIIKRCYILNDNLIMEFK